MLERRNLLILLIGHHLGNDLSLVRQRNSYEVPQSRWTSSQLGEWEQELPMRHMRVVWHSRYITVLQLHDQASENVCSSCHLWHSETFRAYGHVCLIEKNIGFQLPAAKICDSCRRSVWTDVCDHPSVPRHRTQKIDVEQYMVNFSEASSKNREYSRIVISTGERKYRFVIVLQHVNQLHTVSPECSILIFGLNFFSFQILKI